MCTDKLSIVISTHAAQFEAVVFKGDFEANLIKAAEWGYQGAELAIRNPDLVDADGLEKLISNLDMKVPAIGTGQAWGEERISFTSADANIRKAAVDRFNRHIELAQRFDALVIIGLIRGITPKGQTHSQSMQYLTECLTECAEKAAENGVRMAIEPLNRYETDLIHTVQDGLDLIGQIGSSNLGLLLDTFHMNIEEPDIVRSILISREQLFHFHLADSNRWYPGGGHLDFKSIVDGLHDVGYKGWMSGEFMPIPDADTAAQRSILFMKHIIV
jgi:5-keto-L-gluconate epimerase